MVFWTRTRTAPYDLGPMLGVIGNVLAALLAIGLFTATLRITK